MHRFESSAGTHPFHRATGALRIALTTVVTALFVFVAWPASEASAQCAVCDTCTQDADCDAGYVCRNMGAPANLRCTQLCTTGSCPGDSVCYTFTFDGNSEMICLNPGAENVGNCPANYTCTDDGVACTGLGTDCSAGAGACSQLEAFTCLSETDAQGNTRSYCTCQCTSSADCDGSACVSGTCRADVSPGLCANVTCNAGETCDPGTGNCISDPNDLCASVMCPAGAICSPATGTCIGGNADAGMDMGTGMDTSTTTTTTATGADMTSGTDTTTTTGGTSADMSTGTDTNQPGAFFVTAISPTSGANDREQLVQLTGGGFVAGMTVRVGVTQATPVTVASPTIATATVPAGIAPGIYDVIAQLPTGDVFTLPSAYQVAGEGGVVPTGGGDDEGGCCTTVRATPDRELPVAPIALALGIVGLAAVRRRRSG